jgi:hypothetical protein
VDDHLTVIFQTEMKVAELEEIDWLAGQPDDDWEQADWDDFWWYMDRARKVSRQRRALDTSGRSWFALQSILTAAGNLSKLLWGSGDDPDAEGRRAPLRASIGVRDDSPLRSPKVRNQFEHIDQKIDQRLGKQGWLYFGRNMGPYDEFIHYEPEEGEHFGDWDPENGIVRFWDNAISIPEIVAEVARIHPIVQRKVLGPFGRE